MHGDKETLRFRLPNTGGAPVIARVMNCLNATEWMGKEPLSCKLLSIEGAADAATLLVTVGYRPSGWITDARITRLNGWQLELCDLASEAADHGGDGRFRAHDVYDPAEFNDFDFGDQLTEEQT